MSELEQLNISDPNYWPKTRQEKAARLILPYVELPADVIPKRDEIDLENDREVA